MVTRRSIIGGTTSRDVQLADADFTPGSARIDTIITPGVETTEVRGDRVLRVNTSAKIEPEYQVDISDAVDGTLDGGLSYTSLDPSVATVSGAGRTTRMTDGVARINIGTSGERTRQLKLDHTTIDPATTETLTGGAPGSLRDAVTSPVDDAIASLDPVDGLPLWSVMDHGAGAGGSYTWNPDCWVVASGADPTPISVWNDAAANLKRITLITRRHGIGSEHWQVAVGTKVRFVAADGTTVERTVIAKANVGPSNASDGNSTDLVVYLFDSDLPASIGHVEVLPDDWADYLPADPSGDGGGGTNPGERCPLMLVDQDGNATIADSWYLDWIDVFYLPRTPIDARRLLYYQPVADNDSSNPVCLVRGTKLVLVGLRGFANNSGPAVHALKTEINTAIAAADADASVSTGYTLTEADLSGNVNYNGLVARWRFDETGGTTATDDTGTHDGTASGGVAFDGSVAAFDGSTGYISLGTPAALNFTGPFTIAARVNPRVIYGLHRPIICKGDHQWSLKMHTAGVWTAFVNDATWHIAESNTGAIAGQWVTLIGRYDGTTISLFVDGIKQANPATGGLTDKGDPVLIGANSEKPTRHFDGDMSEILAYGRGVTDAEAMAIHTRLAGVTP